MVKYKGSAPDAENNAKKPKKTPAAVTGKMGWPRKSRRDQPREYRLRPPPRPGVTDPKTMLSSLPQQVVEEWNNCSKRKEQTNFINNAIIREDGRLALHVKAGSGMGTSERVKKAEKALRRRLPGLHLAQLAHSGSEMRNSKVGVTGGMKGMSEACSSQLVDLRLSEARPCSAY